MYYRPAVSALALTVIVVVLLIPITSFGQSFWFDGNQRAIVSLEILRPDFVGKDETTTLTAAWFLSARWPVTEDIVVFGELPFAHYADAEGVHEAESQSTIGNPYLGIESQLQDLPVFAELGIRFPLLSRKENELGYYSLTQPDGKEKARLIGMYSEMTRFEAFIPDMATITAILKGRKQFRSGFGFLLYGGQQFCFDIGHDWQGNSALVVSYGALIWFNDRRSSFRVGFVGRAVPLDEKLPFSEGPQAHEMIFGARFKMGKIHPGFRFLLPLNDNTSKTLEYVFGLNLSFQLD